MERLSFSRKAITAIGLGVGSLLVAGCGPNYSGEGNEFVIEGHVLDNGEQSIKVRVDQINEANGAAGGWFEVGEENRIHDNCDCHGAWNGRKTYGTLYAKTGQIIEPVDVPIGECVIVQGKIRAHSEGKTHSERPVFNTATIVNC